MKIVQIAGILVVVLVIAGFAAYSYYEIENSNGHVNISITSSPYNAQSLNVTITTIDLRSSNYSLWTNYSTGGTQINLMDYETPHSYSFGNISLIEGNYTMIRFNITSASAVINGKVLKLKLNRDYAATAGDFNISARVITHFTLEFELDGNVNMTSHTFNPEIDLVD